MKFRRQRSAELGVNLTPLIDVVFLLLIFFMVSTTFTRETQLTIDLPEAEGTPRETVTQPVEVLVAEDGSYRVNGKPVADRRFRTLQAALYDTSAGDTTLPLVIAADAQAPHAAVVLAMDAAGQMGFARLSIATREPAGGGR